MKLKNFLVSIGVLISLASFSQVDKELIIPPKVKNEMLGVFPQTQLIPVKWSKEGSYFRGDLSIMGSPAFVVFDEKGKIIRQENKIHVDYLSKDIVKALNEKYPGNEILEIFEITDTLGAKTYKVTYKLKATSVFKKDGSTVQ